jgi:hypothetical protein
MKKLLSVLLLTLAALPTPAHADWQRRQSASSCAELFQAEKYYEGKFLRTGHTGFRTLMNESRNKAKSMGCR